MNPLDAAISDKELADLFKGSIREHDAVCFYLDANVDQTVTALLKSAEVLFTDAYLEEQVAEKSDIKLLVKARGGMGFVMVSEDRDFREIHERIITLELTHAGIILIKSRSLKDSAEQLANRLIHLAQKYEGGSWVFHNELFTI